MDTNKVIVITGASSGFGKVTAEYLHSLGHKVYGTSRKPSDNSTMYTMLQMDITSDESVDNALLEVINKEGKIDVLINNAGIALAGAVEDTSSDEMRFQIETNFLGTHRLCRKVIPIMRKLETGLIINISSIAGLIGVPFQGSYSASKFALEGMTESMRVELMPYGIKTVLIEPGDFNTEITDNRIYTEMSDSASPYYKNFRKSLDIMEAGEKNGPEPILIARLVASILTKDRPRFRYAIGPFSETFSILLKKILPDKWFLSLLRKSYSI